MDRRQKKLAKKEKKRKEERRQARAEANARPKSVQGFLKAAANLPFGPCWVNETALADSELPALAAVIMTRQMPDGLLIPGICLVDRTCLGVKKSYTARAMTRAEIEARYLGRTDATGEFRAVEVLFAQSIIFHGLDYARSLGFAPGGEVPWEVIGARPEVLMDTPIARPERPFYLSGPDDDVPAVLRQLDKVVGRGNYHFVTDTGMLGEDDDFGGFILDDE